MKSNRKNSKKIMILFPVILIIILIFFVYKAQNSKINANSKNKGIVNTEEVNKNDKKTSEGNGGAVNDKSGENQTSAGNKDTKGTERQENGGTTEGTNSEKSVTVYVKDANFGSTVEMIIENGGFSTDYKYYQLFHEKKPISNIESITKSETTIFPAEEAGSEVILKLLGENKKVFKELNLKLIEKK